MSTDQVHASAQRTMHRQNEVGRQTEINTVLILDSEAQAKLFQIQAFLGHSFLIKANVQEHAQVDDLLCLPIYRCGTMYIFPRQEKYQTKSRLETFWQFRESS